MTKISPILTILVPCFNATKFLSISLPSILNERIYEEKLMKNYEVIIVDDGSSDDTFINANIYAKKWNKKVKNNNFVKVFKKENGQYGSVINFGLRIAKGNYLKVLDVDDHFNVSEFIDFLYVLKGLEKDVDVVITDFLYEKVGTNKSYKWSFSSIFNNSRKININTHSFPRELITMHSLTYRTNLLRDNNYEQIESIYYSDSEYALLPLQFAKKYYYTNITVYGYYIGHDEQSININVMIKNSIHQLMVIEDILKKINFDIVESQKIKKYLISSIRTLLNWRILLIVKDRRIQNKRKEIWKLIKLVQELQPKYSSKILNSILFWIIFVTRGYGTPTLVKVGFKIYNLFRNNVLVD